MRINALAVASVVVACARITQRRASSTRSLYGTGYPNVSYAMITRSKKFVPGRLIAPDGILQSPEHTYPSGPRLPAIDGAPIVHSTIANVLTECTAMVHLVEDASWIRIVDYELIAERQMIPKCLSRIHRGCTAGGEQVAQHQQGNDTLHDTSP